MANLKAIVSIYIFFFVSLLHTMLYFQGRFFSWKFFSPQLSLLNQSFASRFTSKLRSTSQLYVWAFFCSSSPSVLNSTLVTQLVISGVRCPCVHFTLLFHLNSQPLSCLIFRDLSRMSHNLKRGQSQLTKLIRYNQVIPVTSLCHNQLNETIRHFQVIPPTYQFIVSLSGPLEVFRIIYVTLQDTECLTCQP